MKFIVKRESLLKPLQQLTSLLVSRPSLTILSNLLLQATKDQLLLTSTNLEIEIVTHVRLSKTLKSGTTTVSTRKFFNICRGLPEGSEIAIVLEGARLLIRSGHSRYSLSTLPASDFPNIDDWQSSVELVLSQSTLKRLIESTQFSMAYQDVRYYLNGMLFETEVNELRAVATDGHRLAVCTMPIYELLPSCSVIVPRKGVIELLRMLDYVENPVKLTIGTHHIRANIGNYIFTSKLVEGCFPNYRQVLPKNPKNILEAECDMLIQAFSRAAILSNEKFRGIRLYLSTNTLRITANNQEQEEAEEILDVNYQGNEMEIGFNVNYILDVLHVLKCEKARLLFTDGVSSVQIEDNTTQSRTYVIMPMRL
ncbi:DNA polymerase III subunit beta [Candidatus Steffania adelgidicola]|uniref:DNA polymerase III subunit beta n=1 Tax=Candidatus Steffania adelgidicola TaxID=1076626 RepID=UPI001D011637|nr:DNA polymerase III subunit beta [Candidatus Steffania adelgidicola]UDG79692.1 Beta sliding clamp [Candidatus Steffania adelgidicola]